MKPIWLNSTPEQKTILITILAMANFRPSKWEWQGKQFILQEGQFITSLDSLAKACGSGVTIRNIRTALKRFEKCGFLTNESTKTGRLITIENWVIYQGNSVEGDKVTGKDLTKSRQRPDKDLTTKEEGKEGKKVKKDIYTPEFEEFYKLYPNPQNKQRSFKNWKKQLKNETIERLMQAAINYKKLVEIENRERQYIKSSANFFGQENFFIDYLPENFKEPQPKQGQAQKKNGFDNFKKRTYDTVSLKEKLLKKGRGEL